MDFSSLNSHTIFAICASFWLSTAHLMGNMQPATLSVEGSASLKIPADEFHLAMSVISQADSAEMALKHNSQKVEAVIAALKANQLTDSEYSTGSFTITPDYTPYPKDPPADWVQKIIGYRVVNTLLIHTGKISQAGEIIDAVTQAGVNAIDQISFSLKEPQNHQQEAINSATQHAMQDAANLAAAAGLKLGDIQQIWLNQARPPEQSYKMMSTTFNRPTPIEAGDITVDAHVFIVYQLKIAKEA
jgi:hypothetical protein